MSLEIRALSKRYASGVDALREIDLSVADGEIVVIVGPTGCGKTSLLRLIAGLELPSSGEIDIDGRSAVRLAPGDRGLAMVFQDASALQPHLRAEDEIAFGLRARGVSRRDAVERARAVASRMRIEHLLDRKPPSLSGGERRRVALARCLAQEPRHLLLDEPLASLDPPTRELLAEEIRRAHRGIPGATVLVTHDQEDALSLGDRVVVLCEGRIRQSGSPREVHDFPRDIFVARFIGTPTLNVIEAELAQGEDTDRISTAFGEIRLARDARRDLGAHGPPERAEVSSVGFRPRDALLARAMSPDAPTVELRGCIARTEWHPEGNLLVLVPPSPSAARGTASDELGAAAQIRILLRERSERTPGAAHEEISFHVPADRFHIFDAHGKRVRVVAADT